MKRYAAKWLAIAALLGCLAGCGQAKPPQASAGTPPPTPQAVQIPEQPEQKAYPRNVLTGKPYASQKEGGQRITAVMVNNYTECRPQRGLSRANILFEIKVEGGISYFMGLYSTPGELPTVGPLRSGRDQFFRLILPWQPLYVHIGQSDVQAEYIRNYRYDEWNVEGRYDAFWWRDTDRLNLAGETVGLEHTAYTDAIYLQRYVKERQVDAARVYNSPFFHFTEPGQTVLPAEASARQVIVQHSPDYRTRFEYSPERGIYRMSQFYPPQQKYLDTVDENNSEQLSFDNLIVLFTDIHTYPDCEESDLQYVEYNWGGVGYYCWGGQCQRIRWKKGTDLEALSLQDAETGQPLLVNCGTSYVAVVDLDEAPNFLCDDRSLL